MPIYSYECGECLTIVEKYQPMDASAPACCGEVMRKQMTFPAMVKVKGKGGYPSRRKMIGDTAPYCKG